MNKKVISKILFAVFAVALCAAAYFAADIPFFNLTIMNIRIQEPRFSARNGCPLCCRSVSSF